MNLRIDEYRERRLDTLLGHGMTENILHQPVEVVIVPDLDEGHATFLRLELHDASPVTAVEAFDVRVNLDFERALQKGLAPTPADRYRTVGALTGGLASEAGVGSRRSITALLVLFVAVLAVTVFLNPWDNQPLSIRSHAVVDVFQQRS